MEPATFVPLSKTTQQTATGILSVTERAAQEIKTALAGSAAEGYAGVRLGIEGVGHHGYQYSLAFEKAPAPDDIVIESSGVKLFVSTADSESLKGAKVDFIETPMGRGFHVENPNVQSVGGCGCGAGGCGGGSGHGHGGCGCA